MNLEENVTPSDWTCWKTANDRHSEVLWSTNHRGGNEVLKLFFEKIRQKNIPKKNENTVTKPRERMYLDISSTKDESFSRRKHWGMLVDKSTKYKHSFFLKKDLDQIEMISSWLEGVKDNYKFR